MTAALGRLRADSPGAPTRVDPGDFQATAQAFADQQTALIDLMSTLRGQLVPPTSPCIGADHSATYFGTSYRTAAEAVMNGVAELGTVVGAVAQGVAQAGTDHSRADAITKSGWQTTDYTTVDDHRRHRLAFGGAGDHRLRTVVATRSPCLGVAVRERWGVDGDRVGLA